MAGIFANVDSDIQKLRKLKTEIENVKKALKQINVKVDIDIAKGIEAQLKSLMGQYDAFVRKVSEAEGKIMGATKRINEAAEKIVKAQEQLSKAAGVSTQPGSGGADAAGDGAETAGVKAQAKAYDELETEINRVLGTREQNIRKLIEENNAIKLNQRLIRQTEKDYAGSNGVVSEKGLRLLEIYNSNLLRHKAALSEVQQVLRNEEKLYNASENSMSRLSQELGRMRLAYRAMTDDAKSSPFGKELLASIEQADAKIKSLDASIGNHQRNVGNYASGWNGLGMSVQQIVRELPAATMGLNMFFLAISNNLPILTDEIKRAKIANEELKKSGQKGVPVWKQLVSSLFSWQTAMMVGITVLSMYGKEIVEWTGNLFKSKDAILSTEEAMEKVNESLEKNNGSYGSNILSVKKLSSEWKKLSSQKEQLQWIRDNKTEFDKLGVSINGVKDAENAFVKNTDAIIQSLKARAKANAASSLAEEKYREALIKRQKAETKRESKGTSTWNKFLGSLGTGYGATGPASLTKATGNKNVEQNAQRMKEIEAEKLEEEAENVEKLADKYFMLSESYEEEAKSKLKSAGIEESHKEEIDDTNKIINHQDRISELERKNATDRIRQQEDLENKVAQSRIDAMDEGFEKEKAQMELNHKKELQEIGRQRQDYVNAFIQMEKEAFDAKEKLKASNDKNYKPKAFDSSTVSVDTSAFDIMGKEARERQKMEIADFYKYSLSEYQDYVTKYNSTVEKFAKARQKYEEAGASDDQLKEIEHQKEEALKAINKEFASREESFNSWADSVIDLSIEKLRELLNQAYQEMMNMEISDPNNPDLAVKRAKVSTLRNALEKKEIEKEVSPGKSIKDWDKLYKVLTDVNDVFEEIGDTVGGTFGEIISLAGGIASSSLQAVGAIKGIGEAVSGLDKASAILASVSAGMKIISGIGGFFKEKFGADYSEYDALKSQYETLIGIWDQLIGKKMEYIDIDYGIEAQKAADEAAKLVNVQIERQRQLIKQLASSGSSAGSHSLGYRINDRLTAEDYERISGLVGEKITAEYQLWDLSSEQMEKLLTDERLVSVLGEVNGEFIEYIQNIADYGNQLEEIAQKEKEALTGIGLDEFKSGYVDLLSDLDSTNEEFADNFEKYLQNAIFSSLIANKYKDEIESLYDQWAADSESGGRLTPEEAERLRQEQKELTDQMLADREQLMNDFGWEPSGGTSAQQASSAVKVQASQESVDETNGRLTAIQETGYRIENVNQQQAIAITELKGSISGLLSKIGGMYNISDETRTILANSYLELQQIRENTGEIVKPIKQMQKDIEEVKRNTSRL